MKILHAAAELHPFSKTGGLADMAAALGKSQASEGHEVGIVTPLYHGIHARFPDLKWSDYEIVVPMGDEQMTAKLATLKRGKNLTIFFVDQPHYYDRPALYGENNQEYADNHERFIFLSKAVAHIAQYHPFQPDIVHPHDWHVGLVPLFVKHQAMLSGWRAPQSVLTIHNLAYQGHYPKDPAFGLTNLPAELFSMSGVEFYGDINLLKAAIVYTDAITTVSPRYAREICTPEFGCSLDPVLRERSGKLTGILNGVDYDEWNTTRNIHLHHHYSVKKMAGKAKNKLELQHELGLPEREDVPMFGTVTRLTDQKGCELILGAMEEMLPRDIQFVLLGSGDPALQSAFYDLGVRYPDKVCARIGFDLALSHRIEAGSDFFLMPSRFEPCGLNQMYSLRFGTLPIVRRTGGLDDSVIDPREDVDLANGIKFDGCASGPLVKAIRKSLALYEEKEIFKTMRENAMTADFSWRKTAVKYEKIYQSLLNR